MALPAKTCNLYVNHFSVLDKDQIFASSNGSEKYLRVKSQEQSQCSVARLRQLNKLLLLCKHFHVSIIFYFYQLMQKVSTSVLLCLKFKLE